MHPEERRQVVRLLGELEAGCISCYSAFPPSVATETALASLVR